MSQATENRMKEDIEQLKALLAQCKEALIELHYSHTDKTERMYQLILAAIEKELG